MSYEMNGIRPSLPGGNALPSNEARAGRSKDSTAPESRPLKSVEPVREAELDSRALEALAERAARELDSAQSLFRPELEFKVDEVSGRTVITVYHPETEEIIRQIPPEEALRLAHLLRELGSNGDLSEISLIRTRA